MLDSSKIKITPLSDNSVSDIKNVAEWGISFHIEINGEPIMLFDTGGGEACIQNANIACVRLSEIDMILLSHGHSDHTGDLRPVLRQINVEKPGRDSIDILCHPAALDPQFIKQTVRHFYQGCPHDKEELISLGANFITSAESQQITEDIIFSGEIPMNTDFESVAPILFL